MTSAVTNKNLARADMDRSRVSQAPDRFADASSEILASVEAGCSIEDGARSAGVPIATVRRWLRDGRKGRQPYIAFAAAVDRARGDCARAERALKEGPLTPEEADLLLAKAARKGSVPALRLWFEQKSAGEGKSRGEDARKLIESVFGSDDAS
jgi:hypothetical protein